MKSINSAWKKGADGVFVAVKPNVVLRDDKKTDLTSVMAMANEGATLTMDLDETNSAGRKRIADQIKSHGISTFNKFLSTDMDVCKDMKRLLEDHELTNPVYLASLAGTGHHREKEPDDQAVENNAMADLEWVKENELAGITFAAKESVVTERVSEYAKANGLYLAVWEDWVEGPGKCELMAYMKQ